MPTIFSFQQGSETNQARLNAEASPLLGRFRAVPRPQPGPSGLSPRRSRSSSQAHLNLLTAGFRGSVHVGYGALLAAELEDEEDEDTEDDEDEYYSGRIFWPRAAIWVRRMWKKVDATFVTPKAGAVKKLVDLWWTRWSVLVVFPALMVSTMLWWK